MASSLPISVILVRASDRTSLHALESLQTQRHVRPEVIVVERATNAAPPPTPATCIPVVAAPDASHAAALNAGLAAATGEWVIFLHSSDRLVGDMILSECLNWMRKTEAAVVAGEAACNDGHIAKLASRPNPLAGDFVPPSATFYRRSLFAENGDFDATLLHAAHYDFHLRLWKSRVRFKPIPLRIVATDHRTRPSWPAAREEVAVRHRYFSAARSAWWDARSLARGALSR